MPCWEEVEGEGEAGQGGRIPVIPTCEQSKRQLAGLGRDYLHTREASLPCSVPGSPCLAPSPLPRTATSLPSLPPLPYQEEKNMAMPTSCLPLACLPQMESDEQGRAGQGGWNSDTCPCLPCLAQLPATQKAAGGGGRRREENETSAAPAAVSPLHCCLPSFYKTKT